MIDPNEYINHLKPREIEMDIFEFMDFIRPRMKDAHVKGDKEEFIRLTTVLMDTLFDLRRNLTKENIPTINSERIKNGIAPTEGGETNG